jgi:hypothetical protein
MSWVTAAGNDGLSKDTDMQTCVERKDFLQEVTRKHFYQIIKRVVNKSVMKCAHLPIDDFRYSWEGARPI